MHCNFFIEENAFLKFIFFCGIVFYRYCFIGLALYAQKSDEHKRKYRNISKNNVSKNKEENYHYFFFFIKL